MDDHTDEYELATSYNSCIYITGSILQYEVLHVAYQLALQGPHGQQNPSYQDTQLTEKQNETKTFQNKIYS